jgi:hypothetical protein
MNRGDAIVRRLTPPKKLEGIVPCRQDDRRQDDP